MPSRLPFREEQYNTIMKAIGAIEMGLNVQMALLGMKGSGKTVTIKKALMDAGVEDYYYVRCRHTEYLTFLELTRVVLGKERPGLSMLPWNEVAPKIEGKIVVLDEADAFILRGGSELLYLLSRSPVSLVLIGNRFSLIESIRDARVLSSLMPIRVIFNSYTSNELETILLQRAEEALGDASLLDRSAVKLMVAKAAKTGDARYLIMLLKHSLIEARSCDKVTDEHVRRADELIQRMELERSIQQLSAQQRLLLFCATQFERPGDAFEAYNSIAPRLGLEPVTNRRLRMLLAELELTGFFRIVVSSQSERRIVFDDAQTRDMIRRILELSFKEEITSLK